MQHPPQQAFIFLCVAQLFARQQCQHKRVLSRSVLLPHISSLYYHITYHFTYQMLLVISIMENLSATVLIRADLFVDIHSFHCYPTFIVVVVIVIFDSHDKANPNHAAWWITYLYTYYTSLWCSILTWCTCKVGLGGMILQSWNWYGIHHSFHGWYMTTSIQLLLDSRIHWLWSNIFSLNH